MAYETSPAARDGSPTLETAIAALDPVVALLSLIQITGDRTLLDKYESALEGTQDTTREAFVAIDGPVAHDEASAEVANEVRGLLLKAVKSGRQPILPHLDLPLFRRMAKLATGVELRR